MERPMELIHSFSFSELAMKYMVSAGVESSKGSLVITGPSFAISVYVGIDLINLHDGSQEEDDDAEDNVGGIFCNTCTCDFTDYNRAIVETVITRYGPAEVTYVVLTNAFQ
ncbi:hypothetical protein OsI_35228 [Oryza sativa Indica Group]|uniref:Uncharacterized protein n=1 Tax=Oryza sativa subsp. indica TaxID=39946 RepID=A2ZBS8_ORYSI|nr:hypothetical protein OsI_35228 [Oryza sativa Indica Group]